MGENRAVKKLYEVAVFVNQHGMPNRWESSTHLVVNETTNKETHYTISHELAEAISSICPMCTVTSLIVHRQYERKYRVYVEGVGIDARLQLHILRDQEVEFEVLNFAPAVPPDSVTNSIFVRLEEWVEHLPENRLLYATGILQRERVNYR